MRRLTRGREVVEIVALVKQRRLRRVQIFCRNVLFQRAAAERNHAPPCIRYRKHHAIAKTIIGHGNVVARNQQARFHHVFGGNAVGAEMLLQRKAFARTARRIAQAKLQLRRRRYRAVGEIAARFRAIARGQGVREEFRGEIHHVVERLAALLVTRGIRRRRRQRHAGHRSEALDGFREADAFGLHQERDDVAVLAGGEVVVKTLLVVDRERGRLLLLERRQPLELPPRLLQLDAPAHDFGDRKPGAQFVEELGREAHR